METLWNSTYLMLITALQYQTGLDLICAKGGGRDATSSSYMVSATEWVMVRDLSELLEPFYTFTNRTFREGFSTLSSIVPVMLLLRDNLEKFSVSDESWETVQWKMKTMNDMKSKMKDYWDKMLSIDVLIATALDSQIKKTLKVDGMESIGKFAQFAVYTYKK